MKNRLITSLGALAVMGALGSTTALAGTAAGDTTIRGGGSLSFSDTTDTYSVATGLSYFMTDALELGLDVTWSGSESDTSDSTSLGLSPSVYYNFGTSADVVPYVGARYTLISSDSFDTDFYDLEAGVRFFARENAAIRASYIYQTTVDDEFDFDQSVIQFSVEFFF